MPTPRPYDDADNTQIPEATVLAQHDALAPTPMHMPPHTPTSAADPAALSEETVLSTRSTMPSTPPPAQPLHTADMPIADANLSQFTERFHAIVDNVERVVVGKREPIRQCVTALIAGGHMLLEDNPGTGKTQLARGLARSIDTSFKRIQFTPDLLPSDVIGVTFYDQTTGEFSFREGPIFASIVLADEINRASPKTQSALLEVMEEQRVTVDGRTHHVPQPFMVIATQNPIEQLGTYPLPEAQMDRFIMKTTIGYPSHKHSVAILRQANITDRAREISAVATDDEILAMRAIAQDVHIEDSILEYIVRITEATRQDERIAVGASMRGALALTRCARVWAATEGRRYVIPDDVMALAIPVLAHRLTLTADTLFTAVTPEEVLDSIVHDIPVPPTGTLS